MAYKDDVREKMRDKMFDGKIVAMPPRPLVNYKVVMGRSYIKFLETTSSLFLDIKIILKDVFEKIL